MDNPLPIRDMGEGALRRIAKRNGGNLPYTLSECKHLVADYGIRLHDDGGDHQLYVDSGENAWILYNAQASPWDQQCGIIHELVEWILRGDFRDLLDLMYPVSYFRTGGPDPRTRRHRAAEWAEAHYLAWLKSKT